MSQFVSFLNPYEKKGKYEENLHSYKFLFLQHYISNVEEEKEDEKN